MRLATYHAAMAGAFLSLVGFAVEAVDARGRAGGGGGGARAGASTSMSRGGGASHQGGGSGFSRGGSYSKPGGGASASQRPTQGSGNRNQVNGGNTSISGGNTNVSRGNTNINTGNVNINTGNVNNIHVDNGINGYGGWHDYPVAAGVAIGTAAAVTAAAIGASYYALPPSCARYPWQNHTYYYCGGVYYKPQYQGDTIVYVTVAKPK